MSVDREELVQAARRAARAGRTEYMNRQEFYLRMQELERALAVPLPGPDGACGLFDEASDLEDCARSVLAEDGLLQRLTALWRRRADNAALFARAESNLAHVLDALREDEQQAQKANH